MATAEAWWVVCPPSEQNSPTVPKDAIIISTQVGSPFYNTLLNTDHGTVSVKGKQYVRYMGPFLTEQAAQSAVPGPITIGDWVGAAIAGAMAGAGNEPNPNTSVGTGFAAGSAVDSGLNLLGPIADFFHRLTEPQTWIRVGEFAIGGMLVYVGIKASTQGTAVGEAARTVTKPAKKTVSIAKSLTPTGRAVRTITRHERRMKASRTRQRATVIRGKQKEFGRRELYR
jgi:hypothetical protein